MSAAAQSRADGLGLSGADDPMRSLGAMQFLRPKPGDKIKIDHVQATFRPIDPKHVRRDGGINLSAGDIRAICDSTGHQLWRYFADYDIEPFVVTRGHE